MLGWWRHSRLTCTHAEDMALCGAPCNVLLCAGEAAAERSQAQARHQHQHQQHRKPISQLTVTGVSLAVMSRRQREPFTAAAAGGAASPVQGAAAAPASSSAGQGRLDPDAFIATAAASDLAAALAAEGWGESHVLLRQWQCTVALCAAVTASRSSGAAGEAAQQTRAVSRNKPQQAPPAIVLQYQTAGMNEVGAGCSRCLCRPDQLAIRAQRYCSPFNTHASAFCPSMVECLPLFRTLH